MNIREYAAEIINKMPEEKLEAFLLLFADENVLARMESEAVLNDPDALLFSSVEELFEELDS